MGEAGVRLEAPCVHEYTLSEEFLLECLPVKLNATGARAVTVNTLFDPSVSERRHVQDVEAASWRSVRSFLSSQSLLNATEQRYLREVISAQRRMLDVDVARGLLAALRQGSEQWLEGGILTP